jgi:hypothetical protein
VVAIELIFQITISTYINQKIKISLPLAQSFYYLPPKRLIYFYSYHKDERALPGNLPTLICSSPPSRNKAQSIGHEKISAVRGCSGAMQGELLLPGGLEGNYWWEA